MRTLVLNAGYEPLAVVSFKRAIVLVLNEKAVVVEHVDGEPVWAARASYERPAVILLTRYVRVPGRPPHPGDQTRSAAPRCAPVRILRQGGLDHRPHPAALARRSGLVGEPRRVLPALQQHEGRSHASGDEVGPAHHAASAPRRAVDRAGHRPHGSVLGAVPRPRRVEPRSVVAEDAKPPLQEQFESRRVRAADLVDEPMLVLHVRREGRIDRLEPHRGQADDALARVG